MVDTTTTLITQATMQELHGHGRTTKLRARDEEEPDGEIINRRGALFDFVIDQPLKEGVLGMVATMYTRG